MHYTYRLMQRELASLWWTRWVLLSHKPASVSLWRSWRSPAHRAGPGMSHLFLHILFHMHPLRVLSCALWYTDSLECPCNMWTLSGSWMKRVRRKETKYILGTIKEMWIWTQYQIKLWNDYKCSEIYNILTDKVEKALILGSAMKYFQINCYIPNLTWSKYAKC